MRIIAGRFRGRTLQEPPGLTTRPTSDRAREALFSMLVSRMGAFDDLRVADLFAGTGAFGLEALSRGAAHAWFVESDARAAAALRSNIDTLGLSDQARIVRGSALALPPAEPFDLILADPPYAPGSGSEAVQAVARAGWLLPQGMMAVETERGDPVAAAGWDVEAERDIGRARITILRRP